MSRAFSLAYLTLPGTPALDQIRIAGEAGYDCVSLRTIPMGLPGEPQLRLEEEPWRIPELRREMEAAGVRLLDIELVRIREDLSEDYRRAFEAGAELGARHVLSSVWTKDFAFAADRYGEICTQAAEFGLDVNMEFPIVSCMTTFEQAAAMQKQVAMPNLKIFVDTIYAHWDGLTPERIRQLPPESYGIIHLCDCPSRTEGLEITQIVREGREYCGYGQADLVGILKALPQRHCSIELPNVENIRKYGPLGHAKKCLDTAKALFEKYSI